jgi:hypothetical protein
MKLTVAFGARSLSARRDMAVTRCRLSAKTNGFMRFLSATVLALLVFPAPAEEVTYPPESVVVVATPGFDWAASDVSRVLGVRAVPLSVSLVEAAEIARSQSNVVGVVEVEINVDQSFETVYAICRNETGTEIWRVKRMLNFGGRRETLARSMVGALLKKIKGKRCP